MQEKWDAQGKRLPVTSTAPLQSEETTEETGWRKKWEPPEKEIWRGWTRVPAEKNPS